MSVLFMLTSFASCDAQIKNSKTEIFKIYGSCEMCEKHIEAAGNKKKVANVEWNKDTKLATITYDSKKTNQDEILKRIALAGYDNDKFLAPDNLYTALPGCCQYERPKKTKVPSIKTNTSEIQANTTETQNANQLQAVFDSYFAIKDALINSDGNLASGKAKELSNAINAIKMETLSTSEHSVFMSVKNDLVFAVGHIAESKDTDYQRNNFTSLSDNIYKLFKASKQQAPVYYQHCPMFNDGKGANWLSKENPIKNPYYGSQMLGCGKTVETIK